MCTVRSCPSSPVLLIVLLGCYRYVPARMDEIALGAEVRARVSAEAAIRLSEVLDSEDRLLEGKLLERDDSTTLLLVPVATRQNPARIETLHQRLSIPRGEIVDLELKRLDRTRTSALIVLGAVAAGVVVSEQLFGDSREDRRRDDGPPNESLIPRRGLSLYLPLPLPRW